MKRVLQPAGWSPPRGYANGVAAHGTLISVAGQVGGNAQGKIETGDFVAQVRRALENVLAVLAEADAGPEHIVRMTWYVTNKVEYLARGREVGAVFRELIGSYDIAMSAVQVAGLVEEGAKVEIEVTAVR